MEVNLLLSEPLAVCIQAALKSGRKLSWKLQESARGTFVQMVWKSNLPLPQGKARANHRPGPATNHTKWSRKKSPSEQKRNERRLEEFLQRKKASNGTAQVKTQAKGLPTGLPTRTPSATVPGTHVAEHPCTPSGDHLVANKQRLESTTTDETLADMRESSVPVAEEPQCMATPIRATPHSQNTVELVRTSDCLD